MLRKKGRRNSPLMTKGKMLYKVLYLQDKWQRCGGPRWLCGHRGLGKIKNDHIWQKVQVAHIEDK